jgi:hypothetical protein
MPKKLFLFMLIFALPFLLLSCSTPGEGEPADASTTENTVSYSVPSLPAEAAPEETAPVPAESFVKPVPGSRPIAVMIDNEGTRSLPQGGLDKAQVIYEVIVEGGETRLMPVFWNVNPEMIGPVRSSRDYFLDYSMEHDAIYVHFGWSPKAQRDIPKLHINNINGISNGGEIFWDLTKDKGNWQDSYTSMQKILDYVKKVKYRTETDKKPVFSYNQTDTEPAGGQKAEKITLRYSSSYTCGFEYDQPAGVYNRTRKGGPQMERVSGKQLQAKNIIIQYTHNNAINGDDKDRQELDTVGSGKGYFITCGKAIKIKWSKGARSSQTKYTDESGNEIMMNPGQTWVQVLPTTGKVTIE